MDTPGQPQPPAGLQTVMIGTFVALTITAFSAALWGNPEQSARGFRLLTWLHNLGEIELPPAESQESRRP